MTSLTSVHAFSRATPCGRAGRRRRAPAFLIALCLTVLSAFAGTSPAKAAALAEDHTLLYYLIEMQRHFKKSCNGAPVPEAPSLSPSESLRKMAVDSVSSGRAPETVATESGLGSTPHFAVNLPGATAQEAFEHVMSTACPIVVMPEWKYIGAARNNNQWVLIMASAEPGAGQTATAAPDQTAPAAPDQTAPAAPAVSQPPAVQPVAGQPVSAPAVPAAQPASTADPAAVAALPEPSSPVNMGGASPVAPDNRAPAQNTYEAGGSPQPKVLAASSVSQPAPRPAGSSVAVPAGDPSVYGPSSLPSIPPGESAPARPRPVDEIQTDGQGRPIGPVTPLDNNRRGQRAAPAPRHEQPAAPAPVSRSYDPAADSSVYGPSSVSHRSQSESAPAASRPVGEMTIDGQGRAVGPFVPFNGRQPAPRQRETIAAPRPVPVTDGSLRRNDPNAVAPSRITEEVEINSRGGVR